MKRLSVNVVMLGLGVMAYTPKVNATNALSCKQLLTTPIQAEFISLLTQVDGNSIVATSGWKEFYSNEGNFSVFVPDTSVTNLNSKSEDYSINIYYADTKKSSYIVGYIDYYKDLSKIPLIEVYNQFIRQFLGSDIKLLSRENIKLGRYPGIEVEYQNENQEIVAKMRLFLVEQRLYMLDISNPKAGDAQQFFNSFQLQNEMKENPTRIAFQR